MGDRDRARARAATSSVAPRGEAASAVWRLQQLLPFVAVALAGLLVYANTLRNSFHLDDFYRVVDNPGIQRFWPFWRHFADPGTMSTLDRIVQYRPLLPLTLSLNYALHGYSLPGYHLANIFCHIVASFFVYALVLELLTHWCNWQLGVRRRIVLALIVALMFAVHPISGIPVNYISGRDLLLMQLFLGASLLAYLRLRRLGGTWQRWALVVVLFELSLLAKSNPVVLPLIIVAFELTVGDERPWQLRPWLRAVPFGLTIVAHFLYTTLYLRFSDTDNVLNSGAYAPWVYPATQAKLHLFHYLRNVIWPFPIRQQPLIETPQSALDPAFLIGAAGILATLALALWLWKKVPLLSFCLLAYWLLMLPESSILPFFHLAVDYRPYPALPFLFLGVALGLERLRRPQVTTALMLVALVYFAGSSVILNRTWRSEETLWAHSVHYGGDATAHLNYAMSLADRRDPRVRQHLETAIRLSPNYALAHMNLGLLLIDLGYPDAGLAECLLAVRLAPTWGDTHYWLARAYVRLGRAEEAAAASATAARLDAHNIRYQYQAALDAQRVGKYAESLPYLRAVKRVSPAYQETLFAEGFALWQLNQREAAIASYRDFLVYYPNHTQAWFNLGYALMSAGRYDDAILPFERTLQLKPEYAEAHLHLATCYEQIGNAAAAAQHRALYQQSR